MTLDYSRLLSIVCFVIVINASFACALPGARGDDLSKDISGPAVASDPNVRSPGSLAHNDKMAVATTRFVIDAPLDAVWDTLTSFSKYPQIFSRIQSCQVTKQQGSLVWTESDLKPQMFVHQITNRTLNDLKGAPHVLDWHLLEGNFTSVKGRWELGPLSNGKHCQVTYSLAVDAGPVIPGFLVSFMLRLVQKEVISQLKSWVESNAATRTTQGSSSPNNRS